VSFTQYSNLLEQPRQKKAMEKTQVQSGDCVVIGDDPYYLASIRCPRSRNPRNDQEQDFDQPYHYEPKKFVRASLIGNDIKLKLEYERTPPGCADGMKARKYVSIFYIDGCKKSIVYLQGRRSVE